MPGFSEQMTCTVCCLVAFGALLRSGDWGTLPKTPACIDKQRVLWVGYNVKQSLNGLEGDDDQMNYSVNAFFVRGWVLDFCARLNGALILLEGTKSGPKFILGPHSFCASSKMSAPTKKIFPHILILGHRNRTQTVKKGLISGPKSRKCSSRCNLGPLFVPSTKATYG
jgi:hypothetical protein